MQAMVLRQPKTALVLEERAPPDIGPNDALLRQLRQRSGKSLRRSRLHRLYA